MKLSVTISVFVLAVVAIEAIEIPDLTTRFVRAADEDDQFSQEDSGIGYFERRFESPLPSERRIVGSNDENLEKLGEEVEHFISKRSPERVVINYKPPPANGPRHARHADDYEESVN